MVQVAPVDIQTRTVRGPQKFWHVASSGLGARHWVRMARCRPLPGALARAGWVPAAAEAPCAADGAGKLRRLHAFLAEVRKRRTLVSALSGLVSSDESLALWYVYVACLCSLFM